MCPLIVMSAIILLLYYDLIHLRKFALEYFLLEISIIFFVIYCISLLICVLHIFQFTEVSSLLDLYYFCYHEIMLLLFN